MASSSYPGPVSAVQVGSYFVGQYYQVLKQKPDLVHQFYADASTMVRVDGDSSETASTMLEIHTLVMSLNFTAIEIKTINALESWKGGILVMVSGSVKTKDYGGRKFVQNFFLAPQEKGYFVLNDIFQFIEEEIIYQQQSVTIPSENAYHPHSIPLSPEDSIAAQLDASSPIREPTGSDYVLVERATEYVNSVHIQDDTVDKYSLTEQQQHQQDYENEVVVEEAPAEPHASFHRVVEAVQDPPANVLEDNAEDQPKRTYASILRVAKAHAAPSPVAPFPAGQPVVNRSAPASSDWNHVPQPSVPQSDTGLSYIPESGADCADESLGLDEGEPKSVYVRNLPSDVTSEEIEDAFRHFGIIRPDGVFVRNRKDVVGVCYAFVEFEDLQSVHNAIKASPIQLAGRQVFIEERRPNSGIASRGGRGRGRGRVNYPSDATRGRFGARNTGRGSNQDAADFGRPRGNDFYQRGPR